MSYGILERVVLEKVIFLKKSYAALTGRFFQSINR